MDGADTLEAGCHNEVQKAAGFRLFTKSGTKRVISLVEFVPFVGGLVSGGLNAVATRRIGFAADSFFKDGPTWVEVISDVFPQENT